MGSVVVADGGGTAGEITEACNGQADTVLLIGKAENCVAPPLPPPPLAEGIGDAIGNIEAKPPVVFAGDMAAFSCRWLN